MYTIIEHLFYLCSSRPNYYEIGNVLDCYFSKFIPDCATFLSTKLEDKIIFVFENMTIRHTILVSRIQNDIQLESDTLSDDMLEKFREILLSSFPLA